MCDSNRHFRCKAQRRSSCVVAVVAAVGAVMVAQPLMSEASAASIYRGIANGEKVPKQLVAGYLERWFDVKYLSVSLRRHENGELEGDLVLRAEMDSMADESVILDTSDRRQWGRTLARVFLEKHAEPLFEITQLNELHEFNTWVSEWGDSHETVKAVFHRYIQGMQVRKFNLHMTFREGGIDTVRISLTPVPEVLQRVAQTPLLTEQQVRDIVFALPNWEETLEEHRTQKMKMEKVITPRCLAYKVTTSAWEVWMDAATGEVFEVLPLIIWN